MRQRGQELVEYALLVATVGVLVLVGSALFGEVIRGWLEAVLRRLTQSGVG